MASADIILSHETAFRFWQRFTGDRKQLKRSTRRKGLTDTVRLTPALLGELAALGLAPSAGDPLHVLLADADKRGKAPSIVAHVLSRELPMGAFIRVAEHVLVSSPELCFMQLADSRGVAGLILAGSELCGTYALVSEGSGAGRQLAARRPLTSARALVEFLSSAALPYGSRTAKRAATYVFDNAASPMEAKLALLLSLPPALGGCGLPRPMLNADMPLTPEARRVYARSGCRLDLYWPEVRLDVEYDGLEYHGDALSRTSDAARSAALSAMGVEVLQLTFPQVVDIGAFRVVAAYIARKLNHRMRQVNSEVFRERELGLRRFLFAEG